MANLSLSSKQQRQVETLIRSWSTKLTWDLLITAIKNDLGIKISRQSLHTYGGIKNEYDTAKVRLRGLSPELVHKIMQSDVKPAKRVEKLEAENSVMKETIDRQLAFINTMLANANDIPNLDLQALVKPRA
jgi:hypothetical protein